MVRRCLACAVVLALACTVPVMGGIIDYDNSPPCVAALPMCQQKCQPPTDFIFVCSAGGGLNGGPRIKCDCVTPQQPPGGNQRAWGGRARLGGFTALAGGGLGQAPFALDMAQAVFWLDPRF